MTNYKADITLNEQDSLADVLGVEKNLLKVYSTAITEGKSKAFRTKVKNHLESVGNDQFKVFQEMNERGYYVVDDADEQTISKTKTKFSKVKNQLS